MSKPTAGILCFLVAIVFFMLLLFYRQNHGEETLNEFLSGTWWMIGFFFTFLAIGIHLITEKK